MAICRNIALRHQHVQQQMIYSLNSLRRGVPSGIIEGRFMGLLKGHTGSLDYSSDFSKICIYIYIYIANIYPYIVPLNSSFHVLFRYPCITPHIIRKMGSGVQDDLRILFAAWRSFELVVALLMLTNVPDPGSRARRIPGRGFLV